jgi:ABC-type transport system substrate-binding protein
MRILKTSAALSAALAACTLALLAQWPEHPTAGPRTKEGKIDLAAPPPRMRELMEKYRKSFGVPDQERTQLAKEVWKIALDELWVIPVVANSPASQGVRVIKTNMGNIPERLWNSAVSDNPHIAHTETWYFKS